MKPIRILGTVAAIFAAALSCVATPAGAQSSADQAVANFYRGKTVKIVVGLGAGGSFDITARAISRHIGKAIPGNPTVIVENVPGAGSMLALNQIYNTMPKDGTIIGNVSGPILSNQVFGNPAAQFDANKLRILGVSTGERLQANPDLPTMREQGVDMDVTGWFAAMVPAGTPAPVKAKLHEWFVKVVSTPETKAFLNQSGGDPLIETQEQAQKRLLRDIDSWKEWAKMARIVPQ